MNLRALFRRRKPAAPRAITCAEAGRDGYHTRKAIESARYRATAIAIAERIGRPDLAEKLR